MSLIAQLLELRSESILTEAQLQSIVKKFSVPVGSFEKVFGDEAETAAGLLRCAVTDPAYELKSTDPQAAAAKKSLVQSATSNGERDSDAEPKVVKLTGSRAVLVWQGRVITSKEQYDTLVESTVELDEERKMSNAFNNYLSPFKVNHSWVEDATGHNVCEAQDASTAKIIAKLLNDAYPVRQVKKI